MASDLAVRLQSLEKRTNMSKVDYELELYQLAKPGILRAANPQTEAAMQLLDNMVKRRQYDPGEDGVRGAPGQPDEVKPHEVGVLRRFVHDICKPMLDASLVNDALREGAGVMQAVDQGKFISKDEFSQLMIQLKEVQRGQQLTLQAMQNAKVAAAIDVEKTDIADADRKRPDDGKSGDTKNKGK